MKAKLISTIILVLIFICSSAIAGESVTSSGSIHVVVHGVDKIKGQIGILLFEQKEGFPTDNEKALKQVLIPINDTKLNYSFKDLPFGQYAVSVMHDVNMNDMLDTNFLGIPKEGIGISNNARGTLSAPKFKDACFILDKSDITKTIELNY